MHFTLVALALVSSLTSPPALQAPANANIELLGTAIFPGDARDLSGLSDDVLPGVPHDHLGSFGSGIDYLGADNLFIACNDRGPSDGAARYHCRLQLLRIDIDPTNATKVSVKLQRTVTLRDQQGEALTGHLDNLANRFDPEAVRVGASGLIYIADEYAPAIDVFEPLTSHAKHITRTKRLSVPEKFRAQKQALRPAMELPPHVSQGRQPNRGFESLTFLSDHRTVVACTQSPLIQDGALSPAPDLKRVGTNVRLLLLNTDSCTSVEHVYTLDSPKHGISEILADTDGSLLVLERDGEGGTKARFRALYRADLAGATDVSDVTALPSTTLPKDIVAVRKSMLIDFLNPEFNLMGKEMPEKIEGIAFGPSLKDGRRTLIVSSDNDLKPATPTLIWVFALPPRR